jgi:hypothetical protein
LASGEEGEPTHPRIVPLVEPFGAYPFGAYEL